MNKSFAPVVIPTLCRYEHFKQCIDSLMNCRWSEETDVYIGLDYPSKESHWDGYHRIEKYLNSIKDKHPFKNLIVIKREVNYGLGKNGNLDSLVNKVLENNDSMIVSEDDNVFSVAFLDYCNKGLEKFKDDPMVYAICGYSPYFSIYSNDSTFIRQNIEFCAWGYAIWKDRYFITNGLSREWFRKKLSIRSIKYVAKRYGLIKAYEFISHSLPSIHPFIMIDRVLSTYLINSGKDVIVPKISMVRNIGTDGSGVNFKNIKDQDIESFKHQRLYQDPYFEFEGTGTEEKEKNILSYKLNNRLNISKPKFVYMVARRIITGLIGWGKPKAH